jgi:hypothetical protein
MIDSLLELLFVLAEPLLEVLLELIAGAILDAISRLLSSMSDVLEITTPVIAALVYVFLGAVAGGCSLWVFPHHLVHPSRIRGISLLVSPLLTGAALSLFGAFIRSRGKSSNRIETFRYGFAFAFGMALVRLLFAH